MTLVSRLLHPLMGWVVLGMLAFALLPWYFLQSQSLADALWNSWGSESAGSGWFQALRHGRPWLWSGLAGLAISGAALLLPPSRQQGRWLMAGALFGLLGLLASGFAIGAPGWVFATLEAGWGPLEKGQFGMGLGGAVVLLSLVVLLGVAVARLGVFPLRCLCVLSRAAVCGPAGAVCGVPGVAFFGVGVL